MKIAVGLSGGVDSSVAALLLKNEGHEVAGVTMKIWDGSFDFEDDGRSCCFGPGEVRDIEAAESVCRRLGIPHHVIDLAEEYRKEVLEYFRNEYLQGRTPNPCTRCNRSIKLGSLISTARAQGLQFERFATGHYSKLEYDQGRRRVMLKKARDPRKDQSYFLCLVPPAQLSEILLPLGGMTKEEVRAIAADAGWNDLSEKSESQDFIEAKNYKVLFSDEEVRPGMIVDEKGGAVGEHGGIFNFTIGQRKGLTGGSPEPRYVVGIDAENALVRVGKRDALLSRKLRVSELNWIAFETPPLAGFRALCKIRQQHKGAMATVLPDPECATVVIVEFDEDQRAVTPGQTAAFYRGDEVLGGGVIA